MDVQKPRNCRTYICTLGTVTDIYLFIYEHGKFKRDVCSSPHGLWAKKVKVHKQSGTLATFALFDQVTDHPVGEEKVLSVKRKCSSVCWSVGHYSFFRLVYFNESRQATTCYSFKGEEGHWTKPSAEWTNQNKRYWISHTPRTAWPCTLSRNRAVPIMHEFIWKSNIAKEYVLHTRQNKYEHEALHMYYITRYQIKQILHDCLASFTCALRANNNAAFNFTVRWHTIMTSSIKFQLNSLLWWIAWGGRSVVLGGRTHPHPFFPVHC